MDKGTNALSMLRNEVLPLRLGYIAVVNRSQQDIQERISVTKARENEAAFYRNNAMYKSMEGQCGIPALSKRCDPPLPLYEPTAGPACFLPAPRGTWIELQWAHGPVIATPRCVPSEH